MADNFKSESVLYQAGFWFCMILLVYSLATILIIAFIGGPPENAEECFNLLQQSRVKGFLRLDILTVFVMPGYYLLFFCIYHAIRVTADKAAGLSALLVFSGLTLFLATPSVFSFVNLSDRYWLAESSEERDRLLAAGEAILASDMWHGTGPLVGGLLLQTGALIFSILMLNNPFFRKLTGISGIVVHGLDLAHIIMGLFIPVAGLSLMAVAGPLYLVWFPLVEADLLRLAKHKIV